MGDLVLSSLALKVGSRHPQVSDNGESHSTHYHSDSIEGSKHQSQLDIFVLLMGRVHFYQKFENSAIDNGQC